MAHRPVRRRDDVVDVRDPADTAVVPSSATPAFREPPDGPATTILLRPETIAKALLIVVVALTLAGLGARGALYLWPDEVLLHPLRIFDVGAERSIPTWFQSITLALSAFLLATIALAVRQRGDRWALYWGALAAIVLFLSVDEVAAIHEAVGSELKYMLETGAGITPGGAISFVWVVPGVLVVAAVVVTFARFVWRLPPATRRLILVAGGLFLAGAFALEMVSAQIVSLAGGVADWQQADGASKVAVGLLTSAEEMLEMLGAVTLVYALLHHLRDHVGAIDVGFVRSVP